MNRRRFLTRSAAAALGLGLETKRVWSQPNAPIVGVDPQAMLNAMQLQQCNSWCWAACLSTIFNFYGHPVDQKEIVRARFGSVICQGDPTASAIVVGLNGAWTDDNGVSFTSHIKAAYDPVRAVRIDEQNDHR